MVELLVTGAVVVEQEGFLVVPLTRWEAGAIGVSKADVGGGVRLVGRDGSTGRLRATRTGHSPAEAQVGGFPSCLNIWIPTLPQLVGRWAFCALATNYDSFGETFSDPCTHSSGCFGVLTCRF